MRIAALAALLLLAACGRQPGVVFHETADPASLADWGVLSRDGAMLRLAEGVIVDARLVMAGLAGAYLSPLGAVLCAAVLVVVAYGATDRRASRATREVAP